MSGFGKDLDGFELSTETLIFFPASEIPSGDGRGHYLMYNPCDGWHIVELRDGEFYSWANSSPWPRNSIHCWAKLPEVLS